MSELRPLPKNKFVKARPLNPTEGLKGVDALWRGYSAELPDQGTTTLYPLRVGNFGLVLPHIYKERVRRDTKTGAQDALTIINLEVNRRHGVNADRVYDQARLDFRSLIEQLRKEPNTDNPELAEGVQEIYDAYSDLREARQVRVAAELSGIIGNTELYIVARDYRDNSGSKRGTLHVARLAGFENIRHDNNMDLAVVIEDFDGNKGLMPTSYYAPTGVSAPAA